MKQSKSTAQETRPKTHTATRAPRFDFHAESKRATEKFAPGLRSKICGASQIQPVDSPKAQKETSNPPEPLKSLRLQDDEEAAAFINARKLWAGWCRVARFLGGGILPDPWTTELVDFSNHGVNSRVRRRMRQVLSTCCWGYEAQDVAQTRSRVGS